MKSLTSLLSLLCVLVCLPLDAATQVQSPAKPLVIVMGEDSYPYQFVDDAGQPQGILARQPGQRQIARGGADVVLPRPGVLAQSPRT